MIENIQKPRLGLPPGVDPQTAGLRLDPASLDPAAPGGAGAAIAPGETFATRLGDALREVSEIQKQAGDATEKLVRGESIDLHEVMIRQEEAGIAFALLMQTRNKVLEAYKEIMAMSV